ncbi:MAG: EF-hand domain-containing protein [Armatimonadota bacterium]
MRSRRLLGVLVVLTAALAVAIVYAAPREGGPGVGVARLMAKYDANGDGRIDRDEFQGPENQFLRLDANGDGAITADELGGGAAQGDQPGRQAAEGDRPLARRVGDPAQRWERMLERFDTNDDGQISADEFQGAPRVFTLLDQNADGIVTQDEATRLGRRMADQPAGPFAPQEPGAAQGRGRAFAALLQRLDRDADGKLGRTEWPGRPEVFDQLDANADGFISEDEMAAGRERVGQRADPAQIFIRMLDKDGDGQVSIGEWSGFFTAADENADELLSHDELMKQLQQAVRPVPQLFPAGGGMAAPAGE